MLLLCVFDADKQVFDGTNEISIIPEVPNVVLIKANNNLLNSADLQAT